MCCRPVAFLRSREGFISFLQALASITLRGVLMSFIQSCCLLTSQTCAEGWAPFLYRGLSCLPGIGREGSAMGDPSLRARPGHEEARAYGGGPDAIAGPGAAGAQGVSIVVQGTERVDYPTMRGSAARVPPARTATPTCTKEVRSGRKVIGKGKGSKGRTPGGPENIAITTLRPWRSMA